MEHCTKLQIPPAKEAPSPHCSEEFDVVITGSKVLFSWNSQDISEIAHTLGTPDMDRAYRG